MPAVAASECSSTEAEARKASFAAHAMSTVRFNLADLPSHRVLAVIPVYGQQDLTHAVVEDLAREAALVDVVVVDNGGDYTPIGPEDVVRPGFGVLDEHVEIAVLVEEAGIGQLELGGRAVTAGRTRRTSRSTRTASW